MQMLLIAEHAVEVLVRLQENLLSAENRNSKL
jgi:hypothetical protein